MSLALRPLVWGAALLAPAFPAAAQPETPAVQLQVAAEAGSAGVARAAGILCLPSGSLHIQDFMPSAEAVRALLAQTMPSGGPAVVTLAGIGGKLCARDYGMFGLGKRQSFTGSVSFRFEWTAGDETRRAEVVTVKVPRREPATAPAIFTQALSRLAGKIAA